HSDGERCAVCGVRLHSGLWPAGWGGGDRAGLAVHRRISGRPGESGTGKGKAPAHGLAKFLPRTARIDGVSVYRLTDLMNPHFFTPLTRRDMLRRCACGFGYLALTSLLAEPARAAAGMGHNPRAARPTHFLS